MDRLKPGAAKADRHHPMDARSAPAQAMGVSELAGKIDFTLASAMVLPKRHEILPEIEGVEIKCDTAAGGTGRSCK